MSIQLNLANSYIAKSLREKNNFDFIPLTPMKLQKMIYFTYRDYLQKTGNPMFDEKICAWKYGPVVESVYHEFKYYGANGIGKFHRDLNDNIYVINEDATNIGVIIFNLWQKYRKYDGMSLSRITHKQGTAWYKAWVNNNPYLNDEDILNEHIE